MTKIYKTTADAIMVGVHIFIRRLDVGEVTVQARSLCVVVMCLVSGVEGALLERVPGEGALLLDELINTSYKQKFLERPTRSATG